MLFSTKITRLFGLAALTAVIVESDVQTPLAKAPRRPNVVFFLTDDQDVHLGSLSYQPLVRKHLIDNGVSYQHHFCTVALCCPSRVNLWTGKAAHNTNVTDVNPPYGGYPKFVSQGLNEQYLPVWLQKAGYNTYYTGKLFNAHNVDNYNTPYPAGFTASDFLLDPYTYSYLNSTWQRNHDAPVSYEGRHTTDVITEKALGFLKDAVDAQKPFFLTIAPVAPHSNVDFNEMVFGPPVPAERHKHLFQHVKISRTDHFNPQQPSGVNWIRQLPRQNETQVEYNDEFYRSRLRALQGVDELVNVIVELLKKSSILDDTYLIYSSDNGYHIGQHRLPPGKECGYEEDVNVPLIIRGPGIPRAAVTNQVTSHTDLVPTIFKLVGMEPRDDFDGASVPLTHNDISEARTARHEHITIEYWGYALAEGRYGFHEGSRSNTRDGIESNNTYKAVRLISNKYNLYYSVWCNNEHELYDLNTDPYQLRNIYASSDNNTTVRSDTSFAVLGLSVAKIASRLDALLLVLKSCKGVSCIRPWDVLHPLGNVRNLEDALLSGYDEFYEQEQRKVAFSRCEPGYIIDAEGPQEALVFRDGIRWSEWT